MSYEFWDTVADSYTPLLFGLYLVYSLIYFRSGDRLAPLKGLIGIAMCYLVMIADNVLGIWKQASLDYSTHSAVAFALIVFHLHKRDITSPPSVILIASLLLYFVLMLHQEYHTLSTLAVVAPLVIGAYTSILQAVFSPGRLLSRPRQPKTE